MFCMMACSTVPSRGAWVASQFAACSPTAPGMLRATMAGCARDVAAHVAGEEPRAQVVVAARRGGDQHGERLAAIEVRHRIGSGRQRERPCQHQRGGGQTARRHGEPRRAGVETMQNRKESTPPPWRPMVAQPERLAAAGRQSAMTWRSNVGSRKNPPPLKGRS